MHLRDRLRDLARQRGISLQAHLFDVISDQARRQDNLAVLSRFGKGAYGTRHRNPVPRPPHLLSTGGEPGPSPANAPHHA